MSEIPREVAGNQVDCPIPSTVLERSFLILGGGTLPDGGEWARWVDNPTISVAMFALVLVVRR